VPSRETSSIPGSSFPAACEGDFGFAPLGPIVYLRSIAKWFVYIGTLKLLDSVNVGAPVSSSLQAFSAHSVQHEPVHPIASPRIPAGQSFQDNQRVVQLLIPFNGLIQRKIPARPAGGNHPVEYKISILPDGKGLPDLTRISGTELTAISPECFRTQLRVERRN
jgi:hypothetical protein